MTTYRNTYKIEDVIAFIKGSKKEFEKKFGYDAVKEAISGLEKTLEIVQLFEGGN